MATTLATAITSDTERLKQYLKDVYTVEKELYCAQRAVQELEGKIEKAKIKPRPYPKSRFDQSDKMIRNFLIGAIIGAVVGIAIALYNGYEFNIFDGDSWTTMIKWAFIVGIGGAGLGYIKAKQEMEWAEAKRIARDKEAEEQYLNAINTLVPSYQATQHVYAQSIASCEKTLEQLYSSDIIFSKYRNLVAVSQFYEYFMSGRCTTLEGHEGAYNLYENEARQNIIITKLDRVINLLEEIRDTQYQLLEAISESNALLRDVANNTAALAYSNAAIAYNTAAIARNTMC